MCLKHSQTTAASLVCLGWPALGLFLSSFPSFLATSSKAEEEPSSPSLLLPGTTLNNPHLLEDLNLHSNLWEDGWPLCPPGITGAAATVSPGPSLVPPGCGLGMDGHPPEADAAKSQPGHHRDVTSHCPRGEGGSHRPTGIVTGSRRGGEDSSLGERTRLVSCRSGLGKPDLHFGWLWCSRLETQWQLQI